MKTKQNILLLFIIVVLLFSCSHIRGALGISYKKGTSVGSFDQESSKNIENIFINIIKNDKYKEKIISLCKDFNINVSYNDRTSEALFRVNSSNFYVTVNPNNCQLCFYGKYDNFNKNTLIGRFSNSSYQGLLNPKKIKFYDPNDNLNDHKLFYNSMFIQKLKSEDVKEYGFLTNYGVDTRGEEVDCVLSKDIQKFLREECIGEKIIHVEIEGKGDNKYEKELNDVDYAVLTIYRCLYDNINEYEYLKNASYDEIIDVISSVNSLSIDKANLLKNFINLNKNIKNKDKKTIINFIQNNTK